MLRSWVSGEFKLLTRNPALPIILVLLLAATAFGAYTGAGHVAERRQNEQLVWKETEKEWQKRKQEYADVYAGKIPQPSFGVLNYIESHAFLPAGPLAFLATGHDDLSPRHAAVSLWKRNDTLFERYEIDSPTLLREGVLDLGFLVVFVMPILIIALCFDALAADRDQGRLALLRLGRVSLWRLLAARIALRGGAVVVCFMGLSLIGFAIGASLLGTTGESVARLILWLLALSLYGSFWMALCIAVNSYETRAEVNAFLLGLSWIGFVVLLPATLGAMADTLLPAPSKVEHMVAARELENRIREEGNDTLARYFEAHPDLAGDAPPVFDDFFKAHYAVHQNIEARLAPMMAQYRAARGRRDTVCGWLAYATPPAVFLRTLEEIAGSSRTRVNAYLAQATSFADTWHEHLAPSAVGGPRLHPDRLDHLPRFSFAEPPLRQLAPPFLSSALYLVTLTALLAWKAHRRLREDTSVA